MLKPVKLTVIMLTIVIVTACSTAGSDNDHVTLRLSHTGTSGSDDLYAKYSEKFKELVEQKTDGAVEIKTYGSGELYDDFVSATTAVAGGELDLTVTSVSGAYPEIGVEEGDIASAVRLFDSDDEYREFIESDDAYGQIRPLLKDKNVIELDVFPVGKQYLYTKRSIKNLEDFEGLKIRGGGDKTRKILNELGASPANLDLGEVYGAIQQGVLDGVVTGIDAYATRNLYEVAANVTAENYMLSMYPMSLITNEKSWNELKKDDIETIKNEVIPELHDWVIDAVEEYWNDSMQTAKGQAKWTKLSENDVQRLDKLIEEKIYPEYRDVSDIGDKMLDAAEEIAENNDN